MKSVRGTALRMVGGGHPGADEYLGSKPASYGVVNVQGGLVGLAQTVMCIIAYDRAT